MVLLNVLSFLSVTFERALMGLMGGTLISNLEKKQREERKKREDEEHFILEETETVTFINVDNVEFNHFYSYLTCFLS